MYSPLKQSGLCTDRYSSLDYVLTVIAVWIYVLTVIAVWIYVLTVIAVWIYVLTRGIIVLYLCAQ